MTADYWKNFTAAGTIVIETAVRKDAVSELQEHIQAVNANVCAQRLYQGRSNDTEN